MKIIAYILALTVLGLSVYPCSDGLHCDEEQETTSHNHSEDENDNCSPFCVCACCGTSLTRSNISMIEMQFSSPIWEFSFHYSFNYSFAYSAKTWHPPSYC
jgi:hypothetical protein